MKLRQLILLWLGLVAAMAALSYALAAPTATRGTPRSAPSYTAPSTLVVLKVHVVLDEPVQLIGDKYFMRHTCRLCGFRWDTDHFAWGNQPEQHGFDCPTRSYREGITEP